MVIIEVFVTDFYKIFLRCYHQSQKWKNDGWTYKTHCASPQLRNLGSDRKFFKKNVLIHVQFIKLFSFKFSTLKKHIVSYYFVVSVCLLSLVLFINLVHCLQLFGPKNSTFNAWCRCNWLFNSNRKYKPPRTYISY